MEFIAEMNQMLKDVPDEPVIRTADNSMSVVLMIAVIIAAAVLLYFLLRRKRGA